MSPTCHTITTDSLVPASSKKSLQQLGIKSDTVLTLVLKVNQQCKLPSRKGECY